MPPATPIPPTPYQSQSPHPDSLNPWRVCVAPMLDWTDRHCRYLHRLLCKRSRLYTEMVHTNAVLHGDTWRHLHYNTEEHPVALQLGGSDPVSLAQAAKIAQKYGYDEINLNCGCPSARVQRGAFGVCLMQTPWRVADCLRAMQDAVAIPVTVKHRIGIDKDESYSLVCDFVGALAQTGCRVFIVHARNAWITGLSPKENRSIPPLRYGVAYRLKSDFPDCTIVVNGGIQCNDAITEHLRHLDGVMLGRAAYHNPCNMLDWDARFLTKPDSFSAHPQSIQTITATTTHTQNFRFENHRSRADIEAQMVAYMEREQEHHQTPWPAIAKHMLGLYHGVAGARHWRQVWSNHRLKHLAPAAVMQKAHAAMQEGAPASGESSCNGEETRTGRGERI